MWNLKKILSSKGWRWGSHLVNNCSILGQLLIFDIFPPLGQCLACITDYLRWLTKVMVVCLSDNVGLCYLCSCRSHQSRLRIGQLGRTAHPMGCSVRSYTQTDWLSREHVSWRPLIGWELRIWKDKCCVSVTQFEQLGSVYNERLRKRKRNRIFQRYLSKVHTTLL